VREAVRPKFYFFDSGVVRTLSNRIREPLSDFEKGPLLETLVLHEIRSAIAYLNVGGEISYLRTPEGVEIDFIWTRGDAAVANEPAGSSRPQFTCHRSFRLRNAGAFWAAP
jgi:predicted AAA+ superfamily ATPase